MLASEQQALLLDKIQSLPWQARIPLIAGCIMLFTSVLPWLNDPIQGSYSAWQLPVDIGWQLHTGVLNYGILCLFCALLCFFTGYTQIVSSERIKKTRRLVPGYVFLSITCILPWLFFLLQYLFADLHAISTLAQHTTQELLTERQFGYSVSSKLITIIPLKFSTTTLLQRLTLLIDQGTPVTLVPLVSSYLLIRYRHLDAALPRMQFKPRWYLLLLFLLLILLGRSPAATMCEYTAKQSLATGDSVMALRWLDTALILNPALDQTADFHIYRGEAFYIVNSDVHSDDSHAYLAFEYRSTGNYLDAEQEVATLWHSRPGAAWVVEEASITYESLAEFDQRKGTMPVKRAENDVAAMTWLQILLRVDPTNIYAQYLTGRLQYYLNSYGTCTVQMTKVIKLSSNTDIQSSAYTYIGLSVAKQGDIVAARKILFNALKLDPSFHNNTAREELSGLH